MVNSKFKIQNSKLISAFTIVELLVAMTLIVILVALSSVVFAAAVRAHRTADSTIEISRRAEVIAQQLRSDVRGLRKDAPLAIRFERDVTTGVHYDQILFFANGNFQTINRDPNEKTVWGNLSRIYYGHAWEVDYSTRTFLKGYRPNLGSLPFSDLLSRRAHVLTSDLELTPFPDPEDFENTFLVPSENNLPSKNNRLEYDRLALTHWHNLMRNTQNATALLLRNFFNERDMVVTGRPMIDMTQAQTLHLLLSENISEFKVQWAYKSQDLLNPETGLPLPENEFAGVRWWPSEDPAGNGSVLSNFQSMGANEFGVYYQLPGGTAMMDWFSAAGCKTGGFFFRPDFFPRALKFTFTVYDEKGLFPEGRTFTQIVTVE